MSYTYNWEIEREDGNFDVYSFEVEYSYTPGTPPVMHYPDGSGDPGCGPEIEISKVHLMKATIGGKEQNLTIKELNKIEADFEKHMDSNWDDFYERLCDDAVEADQAAEDAHWDSKFDEMRHNT